MSNTKLSHREREVINLCASGLSNEQIARHMGVKIGTVNTYWLRIKQKVGGLSRTDSVLRVLKTGPSRSSESNPLHQLAAVELLKLIVADGQVSAWATDTRLQVTLAFSGPEEAGTSQATVGVGDSLVTLSVGGLLPDGLLESHELALNGEEQELAIGPANFRVRPLRNERAEIIGSIAVRLSTQTLGRLE